MLVSLAASPRMAPTLQVSGRSSDVSVIILLLLSKVLFPFYPPVLHKYNHLSCFYCYTSHASEFRESSFTILFLYLFVCLFYLFYFPFQRDEQSWPKLLLTFVMQWYGLILFAFSFFLRFI
uniref:Uncharacterized protein n=1 Tax=Trypanosoma congolense (strain IL3000) TaxID=1068625 RepID=G0UKV0_TRYCI|nr:hypothetical protein, unlikely [Trypanosoma congolense IL3000]